MSTYKYQESRRNDPELRAKVEKVIRARNEALLQASTLLEQANRILKEQSHFVDDGIYDRQVRSVSIAAYLLKDDADFKNRDITDTYIGNLAAGRLGEQLEAMGDSFKL